MDGMDAREASTDTPRPCIVDRRKLEFREAAILDAIFATPAVAVSLSLPPTRPECVRFLSGTNAVELHYGLAAEPPARSLDPRTLGALLVAYCMRARISLPRKASKSVWVTADSVILELRLEYETLPSLESRAAGNKPPEPTRPVMSWTSTP